MRMSSFQPEKWIFVGDFENDPHSKTQVQTCNDLKYNIRGAIMCHEKEHEKTEACFKVPAFPCFCNTDSQLCVAGLRTTPEQFDELQKMSDEALKERKKS